MNGNTFTSIPSIPMHKSHDEVSKLLSVAEIEAMYIEKRRTAGARILGEDVHVTSSGFVDTAHGAVLTSKVALAKTAANAKFGIERRAENAALAERRNASRVEGARIAANRAAESKLLEKSETSRAENCRWLNRAQLFGISKEAMRRRVRPLAVRRDIAGRRSCARHCAAVSGEGVAALLALIHQKLK